MRLYPAFREAIRSGRADLRGPLTVWLTTAPFDLAHKSPDDLMTVGQPRPLNGEWADAADGSRLTAPPTVWEDVDLIASGCVLCAGSVLVGHCVFPKPRMVAGGDFYLEWPDGVLRLE